MSECALIVGGEGQDGALIAQTLRSRQVIVLQVGRKSIFDGVVRRDFDSSNSLQITEIFSLYKPNFVFYLPADHGPSESKESLRGLSGNVIQTNLDLLIIYLEATRRSSNNCRFFYASSCLVFGQPLSAPQNELTARSPLENYSIVKLLGENLVRYYREKYGLFAITGILYSHESEFRRKDFLFRRILDHAIDVSKGKNESMTVSDLNAEKDWSAARDTVNGILLATSAKLPQDYVIGSGCLQSVRDLCKYAFDYFDLDYRDWIIESHFDLVRSTPKIPYLADSSLLIESTGWSSRISFPDLVSTSIKALENIGGQ